MFLSKIFHRLQIPVSVYREAAQLSVNESLGDVKISLRGTSVPMLHPGDLVSFQYKGRWLSRRQLVIGCKRGRSGNFTAKGTGNWLLCCLELIEEVDPLTIMFNVYYKNPAAIQYAYNDKNLSTRDPFTFYYSFRTFIIKDIKNLYEVEFKKIGDNVRLY